MHDVHHELKYLRTGVLVLLILIYMFVQLACQCSYVSGRLNDIFSCLLFETRGMHEVPYVFSINLACSIVDDSTILLSKL